LTTQIAGDERPKQFCALLDGETLLQGTRRRADLLARWSAPLAITLAMPDDATPTSAAPAR